MKKRGIYPIDEELEAQYREAGDRASYPECCIDAYIEDCWHKINPADVRPSFDGFVPCKECCIDSHRLTRLLSVTHELPSFDLEKDSIAAYVKKLFDEWKKWLEEELEK